MNLARLLARAASALPDAPAVSRGPIRYANYAQLAQRSAELATTLRTRLALAPGDRVGVFMHNCPEYVETVWGAWWGGLATVPINAKLHTREAQYILDNSQARVCFVSPDLATGLAPLAGSPPALEHLIEVGSADYRGLFGGQPAPLHDATSDDLAWLFYTSGTTGRPKGVMLTHRNMMAATWCYFADVDTIAPGDSILHAAPMSHGSGMYGIPHVLAAAHQVIPESGAFEPGEIFSLVAHHRGVAMFAAPTMVKRMVDYARETHPALEGLKTVIYGGGPMYLADIQDALAVMGQRFAQIYGQGETPMTITALAKHHFGATSHPRYAHRLASVGIAQSAVEVVVAGSDDRPVAPGEAGEVLVRGDSVMKGYWRDPEATAATLAGGWLHTGDIGSLDADGFLTLMDRSKDMIISGGSNIYPREVEEVLLLHPGVQEVSVVGRVHEEWGEEVVAFVVRAPGAETAAAELDALCLEHIARFKRPKHYRFVERLPKNNYGKVLKTELRAQLAREADR
ncbi:MAG: AMP-binding protein [Betaproteobacteria bacterium]|jgi:long-chain acyl-CoA synthetase|nr:AMP-binding protein [Betaproteobacteria bacterium]